MTTPDFNHLKNDPALSLTTGERALMRARLLEHMREAPASTASPYALFFQFRYAALALVLIASTTTVSFAAEGALPGEALYPLKVGVNERVEYLLAPGIEAKGKVAVRQAEERIREAEVLAVDNELDATEAETAVKEAQDHIETALANADALSEAGNYAAARGIEARLAATLSAHAELLEAQAEALEGDSAHRIRTLASAIEDASDDRDLAVRADEGDDEAVLAYARAAYVRAKNNLEELRRGIDDEGVPAETAAELSAEHERLSDEFALSEDYAQADDAFYAGDAYRALEKRTVRALTFLTAARDIARETDKEVILALSADENVLPPQENARSAKEAPALMMATTLSLEAAAPADEDAATSSEDALGKQAAPEAADAAEEDQSDSEPMLQFWLRDSLGD